MAGTQNQHRIEDQFPELLVESLKRRAKRWIEFFSVIQSVYLFRTSGIEGFESPTLNEDRFKYILFFEYDAFLYSCYSHWAQYTACQRKWIRGKRRRAPWQSMAKHEFTLIEMQTEMTRLDMVNNKDGWKIKPAAIKNFKRFSKFLNWVDEERKHIDIKNFYAREDDFRPTDWGCFWGNNEDLQYWCNVSDAFLCLHSRTAEAKPHVSHGKEEAPKEEAIENLFIQTGPTWKIVYEGRLLDGLGGKGFPYLHYLVQNPGKEFHVRELDLAIHGSNPEAEHNVPRGRFLENDDTDDFEDGHGSSKKVPQKTFDVNEIAYPEALQKLKQRYLDLNEEIQDAENLQHSEKVEQLKKEQEEILKYIKNSYYAKESKRFRDESTKQKDRICRSLQRAIDLIAKHDQPIARHFRRSINPINSFILAYTPDREIGWSTN